MVAMVFGQLAIAVLVGIVSGLMAGLLGIGGGTILVPFLINWGYTPVQAVATSTLSIIITSTSASLQNWYRGYLDLQKVLYLGIPSIFTAQLGAYFSNLLPSYLLLTTFGIFLLANIFLSYWRNLLSTRSHRDRPQELSQVTSRIAACFLTGSLAGLLAGLFGVGGGLIIVPMQMLLLGEKIKVAVQTSLGVIVITSISACIAHLFKGNVLFIVGLVLGFGGILGSYLTTKYLPKIPDKLVEFCFNVTMVFIALYIFRQAWFLTQLGK
jgi:hypothetical protein